MAIVDIMQTYDQSDVNDYSIADGIHMIHASTNVLQLLLAKVQENAIKVEHIEDEVPKLFSALAATIDSTDQTSIDVTATHGDDRFADADNVNTVIKIDSEYMLVTARTTDNLTVTRGHGSSTAAVHASSANIWIVNQVNTEGADAHSAVGTARTRPYNNIQTLERAIEVTGLQEAVLKLGGISSEMNFQIQKKMIELSDALEMNLVRGVRVDGASSTQQTMGGLETMVTTNSTSDSGTVSTDDIEADILKIFNAGGIPRLILASPKVTQDISNLYKDRIRTEVIEQIGGVNITTIVNPLAQGAISIVPHVLLKGQYFMLDTAKLALGYVRPFFMKDLADDGDADKRGIYGDYTLKIFNENAQAQRSGYTES